MIDDPKLSPTMRRALASVREHPGQPATHLHGGERTVRALMRRWLVEIVEDGVEWRVYPATHEHRFMTTMHMDGCHWYSSSGACACGATISSTYERSVKADAYSAMWFQLDGDENDCARCGELLRGARPRYDVVILRGDPVLVTADEPEGVSA